MLEVGVPRDFDLALVMRQFDEACHRFFGEGVDVRYNLAVIKSEGSENLVVAGSSEVDFAAEIAEFLGEVVFDCSVAIFFFEGDLDVFALEFCESLGEFFDFSWGEVVLLAEHLGVGDACSDVVRDEALVEEGVVANSEGEDLVVDGLTFVPEASSFVHDRNSLMI